MLRMVTKKYFCNLNRINEIKAFHGWSLTLNPLHITIQKYNSIQKNSIILIVLERSLMLAKAAFV